jgi:hypothetical protein
MSLLPTTRLQVQIDLRNAQSLPRIQRVPARDFSAVLYSSGAARGDRMYCLGEQPMTRRKALPKALSDS